MYRYPCPHCRSTNVLHGRECRFDNRPREEIEGAHLHIIAILASGPTSRQSLRTTLDPWDDLHENVLRMLLRDARIELEESVDGDRFSLVPPDEIADRIEPTEGPLRIIYEYGSVAGAHDNSVFAMIAYYASKGLSWEDTRRQVITWLEETGTWERGGFEESSPEMLVDEKRHVHEQGYGWLEKARAAAQVVENSHLVQ